MLPPFSSLQKTAIPHEQTGILRRGKMIYCEIKSFLHNIKLQLIIIEEEWNSWMLNKKTTNSLLHWQYIKWQMFKEEVGLLFFNKSTQKFTWWIHNFDEYNYWVVDCPMIFKSRKFLVCKIWDHSIQHRFFLIMFWCLSYRVFWKIS